MLRTARFAIVTAHVFQTSALSLIQVWESEYAKILTDQMALSAIQQAIARKPDRRQSAFR
jgi:hypothetical protein